MQNSVREESRPVPAADKADKTLWEAPINATLTLLEGADGKNHTKITIKLPDDEGSRNWLLFATGAIIVKPLKVKTVDIGDGRNGEIVLGQD